MNNNNIRTSKRNPCPVCGKTSGCQITPNDAVLCLRTDKNTTPPGWTWRKELSGGMGSLVVRSDSQSEQDKARQRELWQQQRDAQKLERQRRSGYALSIHALDKEAGKLLKQLGLSSGHRQSLRDRGLTDAEIEALGFRTVSKYQKFYAPINSNFPGISNDGQTLQIKDDGFLIPIFNYSGLIIGFQVASDNRSEGKYKHLKSPHLPNGELPLQFYKAGNERVLNITEGTLKPLVTGVRHKLTVLGAGGCNWHSSPQQFEEILEQLNPEQIILNPDAGSLLNPQVLRQYRNLNRFLKGLGYTLLVRDWGQGNQSKSEGLDVDELPTLEGDIKPFEDWAGHEPEESESVISHQSSVISASDWFQRHKLPQMQAELGEVLKRFFGKKLKPYQHRQTAKPEIKPIQHNLYCPECQGTGEIFNEETGQYEPCNDCDGVGQIENDEPEECFAITLWKPQPITSLHYTPGQLPEFEDWQQLGCPVFLIQPGERLGFYAEAYQKGYQFVKDSTPTGHGKSYDAGLINLETFGIDSQDKENKGRIFYLASDHRNPTNATVERNFRDLEARHDGLIYDHSRKTGLGRSFVVRSQGDESDIPSNCPENKTFLTVADLGLPVFGGKDSPICQSCPRLQEGCRFLDSRREVLGNERLIRAEISSIPTPSSDDILIIEESDTSINNTHQSTIRIDEVLKTVGKLHTRYDQRIFKALRPILAAVYVALRRITTEKHKYGVGHSEVMAVLPTVEELNATIWDLYADDFINAENPWCEPVWDYQMIDGEPVPVGRVGWDWVAPSLSDLRNECYKILGNYSKYLNPWDTPEEKQQAIKDNVLPPWLPMLIDCLTGNKRISLRIDNGRLTLTRLEKRHRKMIQSAGLSIALDATQSKQDYALAIGVNANQILEVKEVSRPTENLTIHIIKGLGGCGKQRRDTQQERIKIAVEAIAQRHQGEVGLIDHKSVIGSYSSLELKTGYWFRDTRGSNQFLKTNALISIGRPCPNLGQIASEYQVLTGWTVQPDKVTGRYGGWVNRKINSELIQDVGRLRAHLRPTETLHAYLVADLDEKAISAIRLAYPTATVLIEDVYDIAPEAASKGTQTLRGIIEAVWASLKEGTTATIEQVADKLNLAKCTVTFTLKDRLGIGFKALKKSLVLLLEGLYSKTKLSDLDEDALYIATEYLPNIVRDFEDGHLTAADIVVEVVNTAEAIPQILTAVPIPILCRLLGALTTLLPQRIRAEIRELIPPPKRIALL